MNSRHAELERALAAAVDEPARIDAMLDLVDSLRSDDPARALTLSEDALSRAQRLSLTAAIARGERSVGLCHQTQQDADKAMDHYMAALQIFRNLRDLRGEASVLNDIGVVYYRLGEYEKALEHYLGCFRLQEKLGDKKLQSHSLNNIGNIYYSQGDFVRALRYYEQSLAIDEECGTQTDIAAALNNVGLVYGHLHDNRRAGEFHQRSLAIRRHLGDRAGISHSLNNIGYALACEDRYEEALASYAASLTIRRELGDRPGQANTLYLMGCSLLFLNRPQDAILKLDEALTLAEDMKSWHNVFEIRLTLSKAHKAMDNYQTALAHYEEFYKARVRVFNDESDARLQRLVVQHQLERAQYEKEVYRLKSEKLEMIIKRKSDELAAMALSLVQKSELLGSFEKQVRNLLLSSNGRQGEEAEALLTAIGATGRSTQDWDLFERQLNETQHHFIRALSTRFTSLTTTEIRVCSLLKLGLASKDIASLMGVSARDIESHRYKVRKKLNLQREQNLSSFLTAFDAREIENNLKREDSGYTSTLSARFPDLSAAELKVCSLLKLGLSTKDIASTLTLSSRTVERHRLNIRKKLRLAKAAKLTTFLASV